MIQCSQCGKAFDRKDDNCYVASISGSIMGDEYTDSYFLCCDCNVYTVEVYHDRFMGEDEVSVKGPMPKTVGNAKVALIKQCPEPWDKKCRCQAHLTYFDGWLD